MTTKRFPLLLRLGVVVPLVVVTILVAYGACCTKKQQQPTLPTKETTSTTSTTQTTSPTDTHHVSVSPRVSRRLLLQDEISEEALIEKIAFKLKPVQLQVLSNDDIDDDNDDNDDNDDDKNGEMQERTTLPKLKPHQFLHLHHMKTGGTSMDHMLRCAMDRLRGKQQQRQYHTIPSSSFSNNNNNMDTTVPMTTSEVVVVEQKTTTSGPLYDVPYYSIHECSRSRFTQCLQNRDDSCRIQMKNAAVMSYCSALKNLDEFGWTEWDFLEEQQQPNPPRRSVVVDDDNEDTANTTSQSLSSVTVTPTTAAAAAGAESEPDNGSLQSERIRAFTVLRHPVDRVWSMFKFQTRNCYKCMPLLDIYRHVIDANTNNITVPSPEDGQTQVRHTFDALCLNQLRNHEVANLLTSSHWPEHPDPDDHETQDAMVAEAVSNMKRYFTVIGLTEELVETRRILGTVFPWMNETLEGYKETCPLPHDNSSPTNNRCVKNGKGKPDSHWELPKHPDEDTRRAILAHNAMDMKLYEAAVEYFELQKRALEWGEQES
ncbi:sulfotransferase family protein [Nitzschia inconspicua]|uniref:Sulfotransferase family protein n=1 Tax=Nitzschia inconspicua TaxID=303405 RepID=A0A9K3KRE0_9STRA|nr:sulfotransferase family protein [Nitzschia inconspicua]